jgi:hypothetical protein
VRIYLDNCCLCRLSDDPTQPRIRSEAAAVAHILSRVANRELELIASYQLVSEIEAIPDPLQRELIREPLRYATGMVAESSPLRAEELERLGFRRADAIHLACAESGGCELFLSTDDRLVRRGQRLAGALGLRVVNPSAFVMEEQDGSA